MARVLLVHGSCWCTGSGLEGAEVGDAKAQYVVTITAPFSVQWGIHTNISAVCLRSGIVSLGIMILTRF